jgi:membrane peptidoglycan carboxypeptidase
VNPSSSKPSKPSATKKGQKRSKKRKALLGSLWGLLTLIVLGIGAFVVSYLVIDVPTPNQLANAQSSIVYYSDGKTVMDRISAAGGARESVPITQIPDTMQKAILAAEDRSFYENRGISPTGMARALWNNLTGGSTQGGSTITQQYVKNYFLSSDQTISRKWREAIISIKVDRQQSKDTILANYLNTIYYGRGAYGIQFAAQAYFHKNASQLDLNESAFLAGVVRGPTYYDPANGPKAAADARARWQYVINGMASEGWITPQQKARAHFPDVKKPQRSGDAGPKGYITAEVRNELKNKLKLSDADIDRGGLRITTTIDKQAQDAAVAAVDKDMPTGKNTEHLRVGLTAIKPGDGAIVAMYGGKDYSKSQFNAATQAHMQAGSTFKPFGLIAGLQGDISTHDRFPGYSPQYFPEFESASNPRGKVTNFQNEQFGNINLVTATAHSVNTVFVQLNLQVGPDKTMQAAIDAGLPKDTPGLKPNAANILGTASPTVTDMAGAYATIAAQGKRATPYLVSSVKSVDGAIDYRAKPQTQGVFDKDVMADTTNAMEQVIQQGSGRTAQQLGRPAAGKTGTSSANLSVWFDGFTPQLAAAVGMYNDVNGTPKPLQEIGGFQGLTGSTYPTSIWTDFMIGALKGEKVEQFPPRAGVNDDKVPTSAPTTAPTTTEAPTTTAETTTVTSTATSEPTTSSSSSTTTTPSTSSPPTSSPTSPPRTSSSSRPRTTATHAGGGGGSRDHTRTEPPPAPLPPEPSTTSPDDEKAPARDDALVPAP